MIKLFIDDLRKCPDNTWIVVRNYSKAMQLIKENIGNIQAISLDHDLGEVKTGYDIACFIERNNIFIENVIIHTSNPIGRKNIKDALKNCCSKIAIIIGYDNEEWQNIVEK